MRWCVFCGASPGTGTRYLTYARTVGAALAEAGCELVYGGGNTGLMGAVADGALEAGGRVIGIIPQQLEDREVAHHGISDLRIVGSMHERKAQMAQLSGGFIALPGGFGTFEEFFEAVTWVQLGIHRKPCVLANLDGYYDPLVAQIEHGFDAGFISPVNARIVRVANSLDELIAVIQGTP